MDDLGLDFRLFSDRSSGAQKISSLVHIKNQLQSINKFKILPPEVPTPQSHLKVMDKKRLELGDVGVEIDEPLLAVLLGEAIQKLASS
ncbi:hypothetical protein BTVI_94087 [Pitangus sulphuratus]|nr:hypothetical protein BTVI_94087 [Pitangus sulphuratus]